MRFLRRDGVKCRAKFFGGGQGVRGIDAARRAESIGEILGQNGSFFGILRSIFGKARFGHLSKWRKHPEPALSTGTGII